MTYKQLLKKVKKIVIHCECDTDFGHINQDHVFKTLTVWNNKDGFKIAVRWSDGLNASSLYQPTLQKAYDEMIKNCKEYYDKKHGWTIKC